MMQDCAKLLVVDDDLMMLEFTERAATSLGYLCAIAHDATTAIKRLEEDLQIRVAIIDMRLGRGPNGAQLARELLAIWPALGVILTSGDPGALQSAGQDMPPEVEVLPKPYRRRDLAARLSRML